MSKSYKASAPGSLMLFGEHAVLHGKLALVCAVDQRITVVLKPRSDDVINLNSEGFKEKKIYLQSFLKSKLDFESLANEKWRFVLACIFSLRNKITSGFDLEIKTDFPSDSIGLGSSAAVTVATLGTLSNWLGNKIDPKALLILARKVIRDVQGIGSGADVAASIFGGVLAYKMQPFYVKKIADNLPLTVCYSGSKTPTACVVAKVKEKELSYKKIFAKLYDAMDVCAHEALIAIKKCDLKKVGELMNIHHGLQDALGVSNDALSSIVYSLRNESGIFGAKISGSGLGDCVIGLGTI